MIKNACDTPLNSGAVPTLPQVGGALKGMFQPLTFGVITKTVVNHRVVETTVNVSAQGNIQPFTPRQLLIKPEGQRAWTWFTLYADPSLVLEVDSVVTYLGTATRVESRRDWSQHGFVEYELCQDYT